MYVTDGHVCDTCKKALDIKMDKDTLFIQCDCITQIEHYIVDNVIEAEDLFNERRIIASLRESA
jgi:hypothetical protein